MNEDFDDLFNLENDDDLIFLDAPVEVTHDHCKKTDKIVC